jgi:hypothetical protein
LATEKQKYPRRGSGLPNEKQSGLVLDDYLGAIADVRKRFKLAGPAFRLRQLESYPGAKDALEKIVDLMIRQHGASISTKPDPLLADSGEKIYAEGAVTRAFRYYAICLSPEL